MTWLVTNWCNEAKCVLNFEDTNQVGEWLEQYGRGSFHPELKVEASLNNNKWTLYVDGIEIYSATEIDCITVI